MRFFIVFLLFASVACGKNSSPEGRLTIRLDALQQQLDSLKAQNAVILDSISKLHEEVKSLKHK
jgi:cell division protein FtsB